MCSLKRFLGRFSIVLVFLAFAGLNLTPAPYVVETPGPTFDVLGKTDGKSVLTFDDVKTYPTSGEINALTVSLLGNPENRLSWMRVLKAYIDPSESVVPIEDAFPKGVATKQIQAEDAALMRGSQQDAQAAALKYLGIDYVSRVYIEAMFEDSAAMGILKPGDFIDSVNGEVVNDNDLLRKRVKAWRGGEPIKVGITRKGVSSVVEVTPAKVNGEYYLGVFVTYRYTFPFKIEVDLGDVGGPSAGSMFALGIIDKLTPGALANGQKIAGTGTISPTGEVGPIGGIVQKMYAAKSIGADVFLAPAENCAETVGNTPAGLKVYRIERLNQAVELLKAIQNGTNLSGFATCSK